MGNWKLTLSYDGSAFHGWQVQPGGLRTVQGELAEAIRSVTGETVLPQGSGRTDAGVHALAQVASFELEAPVPAANLRRALNRVLPGSVRVLTAQAVGESFHARHSARGKTYEYRVWERRVRVEGEERAAERICSPFLTGYVWDCRWPVSLDLMQAAAGLFVGTHDFTAMAAGDPDRGVRDEDEDAAAKGKPQSRPNPVKTISASGWEQRMVGVGSGGETEPVLVYRVTGSGFLHHMVRNLVGTMVDVGRGSMMVDDIPGILAGRDRAAAGPTAPARGLFLVDVMYDGDAAVVAAHEAGR